MSVGMVLGECEFPCDHPDFAPEPPVSAQAFDQYRVYEYTDEFGDCSGCIRALNLCYRPGVYKDNDTVFTLEIRNRAGNVELSQDVTVRSMTALGSCENYSPDLSDCCVEQVLPEPFTVNHAHHFSLMAQLYAIGRNMDGTTIVHTPQPLHHQSEMTNGRIMDPISGQNLSVTVIPKPLFFFAMVDY